MSRRLHADEITRQLTTLPAWRWDGTSLHRSVELPTFVGAIHVVDEVAEVAEQMNHHPDVDIRWKRLRFALSTHSEGGVTQLDVELAHRIDEIVVDHGGTRD